MRAMLLVSDLDLAVGLVEKCIFYQLENQLFRPSRVMVLRQATGVFKKGLKHHE